MALLEHALAHARRRPACAPGSGRRSSLPLALHGWLLYHGVFARELRFGFAQALSVMMFLGVAVYWVESLFYSLEGMQPLRAAARRRGGAAAGVVPRPRLERRARRTRPNSSCTSRWR